MKTSLTLFTLSLLIAADGVHAKQAKNDDDEAGGPQAIQAMHHDEAGTVTYRGRSGGSAGEKFSLKIGPAHQGKSWVAVYVGANGCLGDMAGQATVRGDVLELTRDEDGNACSLTIHRSAAGATITENNCGFDRGPSALSTPGAQRSTRCQPRRPRRRPRPSFRIARSNRNGCSARQTGKRTFRPA